MRISFRAKIFLSKKSYQKVSSITKKTNRQFLLSVCFRMRYKDLQIPQKKSTANQAKKKREAIMSNEAVTVTIFSDYI